jgi:hypothetical protein
MRWHAAQMQTHCPLHLPRTLHPPLLLGQSRATAPANTAGAPQQVPTLERAADCSCKVSNRCTARSVAACCLCGNASSGPCTCQAGQGGHTFMQPACTGHLKSAVRSPAGAAHQRVPLATERCRSHLLLHTPKLSRKGPRWCLFALHNYSWGTRLLPSASPAPAPNATCPLQRSTSSLSVVCSTATGLMTKF